MTDTGNTDRTPEDLAADGARVSYQNAASATANVVGLALKAAHDAHPTNAPAIVTGALTAVVRFYVEKTMLAGQAVTVRDVLAGVIKPINAIAEQILGGK